MDRAGEGRRGVGHDEKWREIVEECCSSAFGWSACSKEPGGEQAMDKRGRGRGGRGGSGRGLSCRELRGGERLGRARQ